jgi:flagellar M-ring protein FliF
METERPSFLTQLGNLWARLNSSERLIVVASGLILVVALAVWISVTRQPAYALLYGNLDPSDAGQVISELQSRAVQYKLVDGGKGVQVPANRVDELRITLASEGFSPTGTEGYEILDNAPWGMSDFLQRENRTRAIEGELARTLMSLDEVSAARVHLTLPEPTPFIAEKTEPMASVVLQLTPPGSTLSRDRVAAVRTFVAGAIGSLDSDNVTIIDQNMNLLTGPSTSQPGGLLPTQEETRRSYEMQKASDIRSLLERAYGVGKVAVSFSCEMDFDEVSSESLEYEPLSGTEHGVMVSEERTEDSTSGEGYTVPVGVPGTESNIPSYVSESGQPFESESATETRNYEVSQTHTMRTQAPGTITRCSVGVLIDSSNLPDQSASPGDRTTIEGLVAAAGLLDTTRGDVLTVEFRPFDTSLQEELQAEQAAIASRTMWANIGRFAMAFLVLLIFWLVLKNFLKPIEKTAIMAEAPVTEEEIPGVELPEADAETMEKIRVREEIERLIREDPAAASKVIKTWLKE